MTFYWHDYETWGCRPRIDKPVQFAGLRTDADLNPVGEPLVIFCRPSPDFLPDPSACLITGITPQQALQQGENEVNFFHKIHDEFSKPGTCSVGYNSIRFDDEVTRFGLFRNFYDPYEREWRNGNSRWDLIDVVRLVHALKPETLHWPHQDDGVVSFRLEALSAVNGIAHQSAHDALSDVMATIGLARLIKTRQERLFDYALRLRDKKTVSSLLDLQRKKPMLHISSRFSAKNACAALIVPLAVHPSNTNSVVCYDLSVDPGPLIELDAEELGKRVFSKQEDLPDNLLRVPLKEIHLNKSPMIVTPKVLQEDDYDRLNIDRKRCEQHWLRLCQFDLQPKLTELYTQNLPQDPQDVEQQLYTRYINDVDRRLLPSIRRASADSLAGFSHQLQDERLRTLLFRYRARNFPHCLSDHEKEQWHQWRYDQLTASAKQGGFSLESYFEQLDLLAQQEGVNTSVLQCLYDYADSLLASS